MKKFFILAACCHLCLSCETESLVVKNEPQNNLVNNPILTGKLQRVVQYPTTADNIIDGTSCFAIRLPTTVIANGQTVVISNENGYDQVRGILTASSTDNDVVAIQFPVALIYRDFTESTITSQSQFNSALADCISIVELSCMRLEYPVGMRTYDSNNQLASTFGFSSNMDLFNFLANLLEYDAAAFVYPLQLNAPDGSIVAISDNEQLGLTIDNFTADCLTNDNPNPNPNLSFDTAITQGSWHISYFFDGSDETSDYAGYDFIFHENGTATAQPGNISGTWDSYTDSGELKAIFTFSSPGLNELEEDWDVTEVSQTLIKMMHQSGGGGGTDYLTFQKN